LASLEIFPDTKLLYSTIPKIIVAITLTIDPYEETSFHPLNASG
jgi:hypothetical protein